MNRKLTNDDIQKAVKVFKYSAHVNDDKDVLKLIKSSWDFQSLMVASVLEVAEEVSDEIMPTYQDEKGWVICGDKRLGMVDVKEIIEQTSLWLVSMGT